jgi:hypothetical protein
MPTPGPRHKGGSGGLERKRAYERERRERDWRAKAAKGLEGEGRERIGERRPRKGIGTRKARKGLERESRERIGGRKPRKDWRAKAAKGDSNARGAKEIVPLTLTLSRKGRGTCLVTCYEVLARSRATLKA